MRSAIDETYRRRHVQEAYNQEQGITPQGIRKAIKYITERVQTAAEGRTPYTAPTTLSKKETARVLKELESQMKTAARKLEFEKAALIRDRIIELKRDKLIIE